VHFDQDGLFHQAGRKVFKLCLPYDVDAREFGLLDYSFGDIEGAWAMQVMYLAILSFFPEVISNLHFIAVMVNL
jgi:hypothetical protein